MTRGDGFSWTLAEVTQVIGARLRAGNGSHRATGVSIDSRTLEPGELFFAIKGDRFDGHDFIEQALEEGASGCVVSRAVKHDGADGPAILQVKDMLEALWALARWHRLRLKVPVVAVTGSCGKTTTKDMIRVCLGRPADVHASPASYNNQLGVPLTLLGLKASHRYGVVELGSNAKGEISRLSQLVSPDIAVITHVGASHLAGLEDRAGVLDEKLGIMDGLKPAGRLVVDGDDESLVSGAMARGKKPIRVGLGETCTVRAEQCRVTENGTAFKHKGRVVRTHFLGEHNIRNALAAIAVSDQLDQPLKNVLKALEMFKPAAGRLRLTRSGQMILLDDTYNANPSSVRAAFAVLKDWPGTLRRVMVLGDMLELGAMSERWHRRIGEMAALLKPGLLVTCGYEARFIQKGACDAGLDRRYCFHFKSAESCAPQMADMVQSGDLILVKGSRKMRMEHVIETLIHNQALAHAQPSPISLT